MALTKVKGSGVEGITNLSNATFLSVNASEVATLLTTAVINSEGGAATHNIAQGLVKSNLSFDMSNNGLEESNNVGSVTDRGTGSIYSNFTNNMASANYTVTTGCAATQVGAMGSGDSNRAVISSGDTSARASANGYSTSNTQLDDLLVLAVIVVGDLA